MNINVEIKGEIKMIESGMGNVVQVLEKLGAFL